jgi:hypothetical protein
VIILEDIGFLGHMSETRPGFESLEGHTMSEGARCAMSRHEESLMMLHASGRSSAEGHGGLARKVLGEHMAERDCHRKKTMRSRRSCMRSRRKKMQCGGTSALRIMEVPQ